MLFGVWCVFVCVLLLWIVHFRRLAAIVGFNVVIGQTPTTPKANYKHGIKVCHVIPH